MQKIQSVKRKHTLETLSCESRSVRSIYLKIRKKPREDGTLGMGSGQEKSKLGSWKREEELLMRAALLLMSAGFGFPKWTSSPATLLRRGNNNLPHLLQQGLSQ